MTEKMIRDAYCRIRTIDQTVPDDVLDFMKDAALEKLRKHAVSSMLPEYTEQHIDLAYLTGVLNVVGIDGLHKEIERLKGIGKNPHDIFTEAAYR